jgi:hypothetical protein
MSDRERERHRKAVVEITTFTNSQRDQLEEVVDGAGGSTSPTSPA